MKMPGLESNGYFLRWNSDAPQFQNLHVAVSKIGPVINEPAGVAGNFYSAAGDVSLFRFGKVAGERSQAMKKG
jgi:hypothetical protein